MTRLWTGLVALLLPAAALAAGAQLSIQQVEATEKRWPHARAYVNVIGTAADCDIVLTDKKISRKHATIRYEGGEFQIADLDSSNGCFVNDEKIQKHDLIDNDIIKLGDIEFEFKCRAMREKRE